MPREGSPIRVGITVVAGLAVLAAAIFLIGEKEFLFSRKNRYYIEFDTVNNLTTGNPVQLNGVNVGRVQDIILPEDMGETELRVWITVERRYAPRIRQDSLARIQTLGLLGDKYVALSSGTPAFPVIEPEGEIPAAPTAEIDELLASGGDVVDNLVIAASSLSNILAKMEEGEGLLGALISDPESGPGLSETVRDILDEMRIVIADIRQGEGTMARLIYDDELGEQLETTIEDVRDLLAKMDEGEGLLPALLGDRELREDFSTVVENLGQTTKRLDETVTDLGEGDGLFSRLVEDEELADELTTELRSLLRNLNEASEKLNQGDGTAAMLLNDPDVYDAINDILVGINESKILRWLVRNRQRSGIRERYQDAREETGASR